MRSDGARGAWPDWYLDIIVGQKLGIPAMQVADLPAEWYLNALDAISVENKYQEEALRKARQ